MLKLSNLKGVFRMGIHFDKEYKTQAARLVVEEGRKTTQLAEELDISPKTLGRWVRIY
jgi:transposase